MKDEPVEIFHRFNKLKHSVIAQPLVAQLHQKTYFLLPLSKYFFPKTLEVTRKSRIFAEEKLHSANWKQAFFPLVCIFFAEEKLHSANWKQAFFALVCIFFVPKSVCLLLEDQIKTLLYG